MTIRIEPITEALTDAFHAALDAVARERRFLAVLQAPPLEDMRKFVADNLQAGNPQFVALAGDELVGWCDVTRMRAETMKHSGSLAMGLLPRWRGQGIGARLIQPTLTAAWAAGLLRVELGVRADNTSAIRLYERHGFQLEGRRKAALHIDGTHHDLLLMASMHPSFSGGDGR